MLINYLSNEWRITTEKIECIYFNCLKEKMNEKNSINLRGHCLYYLMFSILNFVVKNIFTFCDCFR